MEWEYEEDNDGFDDPNYVIGGTAPHCDRLFSKYEDDANNTPTNEVSLEDIATYAGKLGALKMKGAPPSVMLCHIYPSPTVSLFIDSSRPLPIHISLSHACHCVELSEIAHEYEITLQRQLIFPHDYRLRPQPGTKRL